MSAPPTIIDGKLADLSVLRHGALAKALAALDGDGEETRLVGGAVRDLIRGEAHGDFDLATTATPDVTMRRAVAAGLKVVPTGVEHGTVTVVVDGVPFETTSLREDVETFGRHARVHFGRDFRADALRRDFTINALSLDGSGLVHDYCDGVADITAQRVRFIGDARTRIREDYLRILRFFRFSARFAAGPLDAEGFSAALAERDGVEILSRERVRAELLKWLVAPRAGEVVEAVADAGFFEPLFAGTVDAARLKRAIIVEARRAEAPDPILRLAALGVQVREDAERLRERLRLSNAEGERLDRIARTNEALHGLVAPPSLGDLRILLFERGRQGARDAMTFAEIDAGAAADPARFASAYRFVNDTPPPQLPFSGADILARGIGPGQRVGAALKRLQASWIRAGFPREPDVLARLLDEATRE